MARVQDAADAQLCPGVWEVREREPLFFSLDGGVTFTQETVDSILAAKIALVELAVVIVGDLIVNLEEGGKEGVLVVTIDHNGRLDGDEEHFRDGDRLRGGVVELYEVRFGLIRLRCVDRGVHNCARTKDVGEGVSLFNASAGGGYASSWLGLSSRYRLQNRPSSYLMFK